MYHDRKQQYSYIGSGAVCWCLNNSLQRFATWFATQCWKEGFVLKWFPVKPVPLLASLYLGNVFPVFTKAMSWPYKHMWLLLVDNSQQWISQEHGYNPHRGCPHPKKLLGHSLLLPRIRWGHLFSSIGALPSQNRTWAFLFCIWHLAISSFCVWNTVKVRCG